MREHHAGVEALWLPREHDVERLLIIERETQLTIDLGDGERLAVESLDAQVGGLGTKRDAVTRAGSRFDLDDGREEVTKRSRGACLETVDGLSLRRRPWLLRADRRRDEAGPAEAAVA